MWSLVLYFFIFFYLPATFIFNVLSSSDASGSSEDLTLPNSSLHLVWGMKCSCHSNLADRWQLAKVSLTWSFYKKKEEKDEWKTGVAGLSGSHKQWILFYSEGPPFSRMIQSINLFRWNCLWNTFPCWNKTSIDNTNFSAFEGFSQIHSRDQLWKKDLLAGDGSGTPQETKLRVFASQQCCRPTTTALSK